MASGPIHVGGRRRSGAKRAEGRSGSPSGAGKRARRSGAQPGLDEVGKVLSRCDEALVPELAHHLAEYASAGRTGLVFVGARGGVLRRNNFRRIWLRALKATGLGDVHFHDLRHTGNTLAATGGATTRELMHRMGHSSVRAALIYQHLVNGRDHQIADYVDGQIKKVKRPSHDPSGT
ncbi:tyrosine-type recombinase/integrase [Streptomyces avermitilis]|uniref:tyrosine-type recombinase/integrase n=1 Tax=Streptomyces avermitilis TaxID=33903 RepID=UPI0033BADDF9